MEEVSKKLSSKPALLVIVGPTASGKTALAIELAQKFNGEIICADSRTVYKHLDIGTAKPSPEEQKVVQHHLLDVVEPDEPFTASDFKKLASEAIQDISARSKLPIMVGGSGLYVDAVLFDYQFSEAGAKRDKTNPRHVDKSAQGSRGEMRSNTIVLGLKVDRETLRSRITTRVDAMVAAGFLKEVAYLLGRYPDSKALDAPGYKAFRRYLEGQISLDEAKSLFIKNDLALAKRQMTWFRRNNAIQWFDSAQGALTAATNLLIDSKKSGKNSSIITTP